MEITDVLELKASEPCRHYISLQNNKSEWFHVRCTVIGPHETHIQEYLGKHSRVTVTWENRYGS